MLKYILVVGLLTGCGSPTSVPPVIEYVCSTTTAITNGYVSIDRRATVRLNGCSGTIIGPHTVLTAAHCTPEELTYNVVVSVEGDKSYEAVDTFPHPDYTGPSENDIGLIFVEETLPEPYARVATPSPDECHYLVMQGYGYTDAEEKDFGKLHEAAAYELETTAELIYYRGPDGAQTCYGDSGGPVYAITEEGELILISLAAKLGDENCQDGYGVGPNLQNHAEWIAENTL